MRLKCELSDSKRLLLTVLLGVGLARFIAGQSSSGPPPAFEVVSIKPNPQRTIPSPAKTGRMLSVAKRGYAGPLPAELRGISGDSFEDLAASVADLIVDAYHIRPFQIFGLPKWADFEGEAYDLRAKVPAGVPASSDQVRRMLQATLASRFRLKAHRESRTIPVYELSVVKGGPKLKQAAAGMAGAIEFVSLTRLIEQFLDRPISDKTGLSGRFENRWSQDQLLQERRAAGGTGVVPSIFTAVKDQLGLELKAAKAPFEVLVIDSVERPSTN